MFSSLFFYLWLINRKIANKIDAHRDSTHIVEQKKGGGIEYNRGEGS